MTDGERWAREALTELRAARFGPAAWMRFLSSSFARAAANRRARPALAQETAVLAAGGAGLWACLGAVGEAAWSGARAWGLAAAGGLWWLAVCLMLAWHLGMVERLDGRPLARLGPANVLSLLRAGLVPALPALSPVGLAAALAAAHATDVLDGRLARRRGEVTRLGQWLDGAVDAALLPVAAVSAARAGLVSGFAAALVTARYALPALLVAGASFGWAEPPPQEGRVPGRVPGFVLLLGLVLAGFRLPGSEELVLAGAAGGLATLGATAWRLGRRHARPRTAAPPADEAGLVRGS